MVEYAVIGAIGTSVLLNVIDHSHNWFNSLLYSWRRYNRETTRITKHNNEHVYRLISELIHPYCMKLQHREMVTFFYKWSENEEKNKIMYVLEPDASITIEVIDEKETKTLELYRFKDPLQESYDLYSKDVSTIDMFLKPIFIRLGMNDKEIERLTGKSTSLVNVYSSNSL